MAGSDDDDDRQQQLAKKFIKKKKKKIVEESEPESDQEKDMDDDEFEAPVTEEDVKFVANDSHESGDEIDHAAIMRASEDSDPDDEDYTVGGESAGEDEEEDPDEDQGEGDDDDDERFPASTVSKLAGRKGKGVPPPLKPPAKKSKKKKKVQESDDEDEEDDNKKKKKNKRKRSSMEAGSDEEREEEEAERKFKKKLAKLEEEEKKQKKKKPKKEEEEVVKPKAPIPIKSYADLGIGSDGCIKIHDVKYRVIHCEFKHWEEATPAVSTTAKAKCMATLTRDPNCKRDQEKFPLRRTGVFYLNNKYKEINVKQADIMLKDLSVTQRKELIDMAFRENNVVLKKGLDGKDAPASLIPEQFYRGLKAQRDAKLSKTASPSSSKRDKDLKSMLTSGEVVTQRIVKDAKTGEFVKKDIKTIQTPLLQTASRQTKAIPFPPPVDTEHYKPVEVKEAGDWVVTRVTVRSKHDPPSESSSLKTISELFKANSTLFEFGAQQTKTVALLTNAVYGACTSGKPDDYLTSREQTILYYAYLMWTSEGQARVAPPPPPPPAPTPKQATAMPAPEQKEQPTIKPKKEPTKPVPKDKQVSDSPLPTSSPPLVLVTDDSLPEI